MSKLRLLGGLFLLPWLLIATFGSHYAAAAPAQQTGPQTFTVLVGTGISTTAGDKPSWQGQNFYPGTVTVHVGDTVTWKHNSGAEPHTVTFLGTFTGTLDLPIPDPAASQPVGAPPKLIFNPMVVNPAGGNTYDGSTFSNSGFMAADVPGPKEYSLTFPKAGTYDYLCLLHGAVTPAGLAGMAGKVVVVDTATALPMTPEQVTAEGQKEIDSDTARAKSLEPAMESQVKPDETMPDGSTKHHITVGNMDMERNLEYQRFAPSELHVKVGDSVDFSLGMAPAFHTVTFGDEPDLFAVEPQQAGPPKLVLNPAVIFPAGGNVHTGGGYYNSGVLAGPGSPPQAGLQDYVLTFSTAGRYEYICVPHYPLGMSGAIVVEAAATGGGTPSTEPGTGVPGMPTTGSGEQGVWLMMALLSTLVVGAGAVIRLRTRKQA
jgi:plastocyanin